MDSLWAVVIGDHPFLSNSQTFSSKPLNVDVMTDLMFAQQVVEAQMLSSFPMLAFQRTPEIEGDIPLFEDVSLLPPSQWENIDKTETILANARMLDICKTGGAWPDFSNFDSMKLFELFENEMFCVVVVGNSED